MPNNLENEPKIGVKNLENLENMKNQSVYTLNRNIDRAAKSRLLRIRHNLPFKRHNQKIKNQERFL